MFSTLTVISAAGPSAGRGIDGFEPVRTSSISGNAPGAGSDINQACLASVETGLRCALRPGGRNAQARHIRALAV
jgi:hypothetical protein